MTDTSAQREGLSPPPPAGKLRRISRWYTTTAILFFNTILLFVLLNVAAWLGLMVWQKLHPKGDVNPGSFAESALREVYAPMSDDDRRTLIRETWSRPLAFEQYVQIRERPFTGKFVNVSEHGYRHTAPQGPWPIDPANFNIFVFGGSTTFGYGVADDQTIPAHLQQMLNAKPHPKPICIYNFGRGFYFSTPERILFEQLLQSGAKPDRVIFIDGLNDFFHADGAFGYSDEFSQVMESMGSGKRGSKAMIDLLGDLPISRALAAFRRKTADPTRLQKLDPNLLPQVIDRYVWNKRAIEAVCREMGIKPTFVFQPSPLYQYDLKSHLFKGADWDQLMQRFEGYPLMEKYRTEHPMGDDFLWLADMQKDVHKPLYCDNVHYTSAFSREIAAKIAEFLSRE